MGGNLTGHILSVATTTWVLGFVLSALALAASYICIRWNVCLAWVRRRFVKQYKYDYKEIIRTYLNKINSEDERKNLYQTVLEVVSEIVSSGDVSLLVKENNEYVIKESLGSKPVSFKVCDIGDFLKWLSKYCHTVTRDQLVNRKEFAKVKGMGLQYCVQFHAEACVPLFRAGEIFGVVNIGARANDEPFNREIRELLDIIGGQVGVAIQNANFQEELSRNSMQLQEARRLKNQLLSNISHELRTPLNSIIGLADVMLESNSGATPEESRSHLEMISQSGKRLLDTVSSMVDLAKLEANHLSLDVKRINVSKVIAKVAEDVVPKPSPEKSLSFRLTFNGNMPAVYGDEEWLKKMFTHVIGNAVKYTPQGEIVVDAERYGEMLRVGIHDTGIGIPADKQAEIFEGFTQGNGEINRSYEGTGVGLAISRKVVELHGGRIWLNSAPGKGSHFYMTLPLKPTSIKSMELS